MKLSVRFLVRCAVSRIDLMSAAKTRANFMKDHVHFKGEPPVAVARNRHRISEAGRLQRALIDTYTVVLAASRGRHRVIIVQARTS